LLISVLAVYGTEIQLLSSCYALSYHLWIINLLANMGAFTNDDIERENLHYRLLCQSLIISLNEQMSELVVVIYSSI